MHDGAMYDDARLAKLKELKRLMMELELSGEDGEISPEALEVAMEEAGDSAAEETAGLAMEGEMEPEADPLAEKRRAFFNPKPKAPRPGTASVMVSSFQKGRSKTEDLGKGKGKMKKGA